MSRTISVYRRRPGLIDMHWPYRSGVSAYVLKYGDNFDDSSFTDLVTVPASGYASKSVINNRLDGAFKNDTRVALNLDDFSLDDADPLWIRIAPVDLMGSEGAAESIHLILPYSSQPRRQVILNGTVPVAADLSHSLEVQIPTCINPVIQNAGSNNLYVAFEPTGSEFEIFPLSTYAINYYSAYASFNQIFLRSTSGSTTVNVQCVLRNEQSL